MSIMKPELIKEISTVETHSYKPIYLIFTYLLLINFIISAKSMQIESFMPNFMASFFFVFSFFKFLDLKGFAKGYSSYDIIASNFYFYGYIYPFLELGFGLGYLFLGKNIFLNIIVFIVMFISSIGVIRAKFGGERFTCACVGTFLKVPLGNIAIIEDVTMTIMAVLLIFGV